MWSEPAIITHLKASPKLQAARQKFEEAKGLIRGAIGDGDMERYRKMKTKTYLGGEEIKRDWPFWAAYTLLQRWKLPPALETQESWDTWRTEVLRILEEHHKKSLEV